MVFKDSLSGIILYTEFVTTETSFLYLKGVEIIAQRGIKIQSIICDGRRGIIQSFSAIPVQIGQFHQVAIIRRYLTMRPKMTASIELWAVAQLLTKTCKEMFASRACLRLAY